MFLLALLGILATSFFGWVVLAVTGIMLIWMVARIHQEFAGGSGTKKLWPSIWFLGVPLIYLGLALWRPGMFPDGEATTGFVSNMWANLTFWHALKTLSWYVLIGLGYSLFEMRVTLWRDKKGVVTKFESYLQRGIKATLLDYLQTSLGSSASGPEDKLLSVAQSAAATAKASVSNAVTAVEVKVKTWAHMIPGELTLAAAFLRSVNPKEVLANAEQGFKDDVVKFEDGLKKFLAEYNHDSFNPNTAYLEVSVNTDGTLDPNIKKADLAICLANWTFWWWAYALNFVFGDMFEAIFTRLSAWIAKVYGGYVKKYFADITAIKL